MPIQMNETTYNRTDRNGAETMENDNENDRNTAENDRKHRRNDRNRAETKHLNSTQNAKPPRAWQFELNLNAKNRWMSVELSTKIA